MNNNVNSFTTWPPDHLFRGPNSPPTVTEVCQMVYELSLLNNKPYPKQTHKMGQKHNSIKQ